MSLSNESVLISLQHSTAQHLTMPCIPCKPVLSIIHNCMNSVKQTHICWHFFFLFFILFFSICWYGLLGNRIFMRKFVIKFWQTKISYRLPKGHKNSFEKFYSFSLGNQTAHSHTQHTSILIITGN